jgi:hypothetical protein
VTAEDAWAPGTSEGKPAAALPNVMDLANRVIKEVTADFGSFLLAGLGILIVGMGVGIGGVVFIYGGMFGGMMLGVALDNEELAGIGMLGGTMIGVLLLVGIAVVVTAPLGASMQRAVWKYVTTGEKLTMAAPFSTATQDLANTYLHALLTAGIMMLALAMCYLPAFFVGALLIFAGPAVHVHRMSPIAAIRFSAGHVLQNTSWHLGFFGIAFVINIVLANVPLIGPMLLSVIAPLYVLLAYKEIFGVDGPEGAGGMA